MNLNYCPVPGASQPRGMRFDTENSRCIPTEWMTRTNHASCTAWPLSAAPKPVLAAG